MIRDIEWVFNLSHGNSLNSSSPIKSSSPAQQHFERCQRNLFPPIWNFNPSNVIWILISPLCHWGLVTFFCFMNCTTMFYAFSFLSEATERFSYRVDEKNWKSFFFVAVLTKFFWVSVKKISGARRGNLTFTPKTHNQGEQRVVNSSRHWNFFFQFWHFSSSRFSCFLIMKCHVEAWMENSHRWYWHFKETWY